MHRDPGQGPLEPRTGPRVPSWDSAASSALIAARDTPLPSSARGVGGGGALGGRLGCPWAAPSAGWSWTELGLWLKGETPQRGGPGLSGEKTPLSADGEPTGHRARHPGRARALRTLLTRVQDGPK